MSPAAPTKALPVLPSTPPKAVRRKQSLGVRLLNSALNVILLSICCYFLVDYIYPAQPSRLSRLLSWLSGEYDNPHYSGIGVNTNRAYTATSRLTPTVSVSNCTALLSLLGPFDAVERVNVSELSSAKFQSSFVQSGRPLLVTGVGDAWPIANMSLAGLREWIGDEPLTKRTALGSAGELRQLTVLDYLLGVSAKADTLNSLLGNTTRSGGNLTSTYYYSWTNAAHNQSLLAAGLYNTPPFIGEQPWLGEWLYIGALGKGVTPHIDHICLAKWSYQLTGCKRWTLASSTPHLHRGFPTGRGVDVDVCAGDTLVFWPDQVHSTVCTSVPEDGACVSLNAYILLDERNCHVQSMIEDGLSRLHGVRSAAAANSTFEAPRDYIQHCPPRFTLRAKRRLSQRTAGNRNSASESPRSALAAGGTTREL